jgi:inner membrane protein
MHFEIQSTFKMNTQVKNNMPARLWFQSWLILNIGLVTYFIYRAFAEESATPAVGFIFLSLVVSLVGGAPALVILHFGFGIIVKSLNTPSKKIIFLFLLNYAIALLYGIVPAHLLNDDSTVYWEGFLQVFALSAIVLTLCSFIALFINLKRIHNYFTFVQDSPYIRTKILHNQILKIMDQYQQTHPASSENNKLNGNKALIKGLLTGGLILLMLIPTFFISDLVNEREKRQQSVVKDVSSKWAAAQTVTSPYLFIPYHQRTKATDGKEMVSTEFLVLLPDNLDVSGKIVPEERLRSIYKVLLYKTTLNSKGNFVIQLPKTINAADLLLNEAKVCVGISDFKGIEKKIDININGSNYTLTPGLPTNNIDSAGLSAAINLSQEDITKPIIFDMPLQLKGSEQLHFVPLAGNSQFAIQSDWANPSFDGNTIPSERVVTEKGFSAKWVFNKANLPFNTLLTESQINKQAYAFGISMLQPADQYAKTTRSVKYAILIIGLTFSVFFIVELMQKKPVHPVQYVLIGIALVIFYTLLLSISEFVLFDKAYLIAALATILLITLYAKGHFKSWKTAGIFASTLSSLYGFIFILIRLEDTALLVGSIGLFIVLSLVMYASRKINWYQASPNEQLAINN